ncbi:MAG: SDR family oxidoreductase [Deltaproteobacteria bacterium]|nr:SDR family oxidoreductase [Deltaproteobacteria bacterium]MBW2361581.1 SDR family oxidoreductase [Deltaproteobacteria bacterium]
MERRVAFVTGASRGIGRASSIALAERGYDVVITARTLKEGTGVARGSSLHDAREVPVSGSLESTAAEIEKQGRRALSIRLDLLDRESCERAVDDALEQWGRIDLLLNNGVYQGPGVMDRFLDVPPDQVHTIFLGNVFNQIAITQRVLRHMLGRPGRGVILNMTSTSGTIDPPGPVGEGGWGYVYAASKGAFHRMAGILHAEHAGDDIHVFNVNPGYTPTETMRALAGSDTDLDAAFVGVPPEATAKVVAWLAADPAADEWRGQTVIAPKLCNKLGLLPGWKPPRRR